MARPHHSTSYLNELHARDPAELKEAIRTAIFQSAGSVTEAARILDVSHLCLIRWLHRMGMIHEPRIVRKEMAGRFRLTA